MSLKLPLRARLELARARLAKQENWIQGDARKGDCYCLWGALFYDPDQPTQWPCADHGELVAHVRSAIEKVTGQNCLSIPIFNDAHGRKHEEVIKVLDHAISTAG